MRPVISIPRMEGGVIKEYDGRGEVRIFVNITMYPSTAII
jgi:hypothetical protein